MKIINWRAGLLLALLLAINACSGGSGDDKNDTSGKTAGNSSNWNEMQWGQGSWR